MKEQNEDYENLKREKGLLKKEILGLKVENEKLGRELRTSQNKT